MLNASVMTVLARDVMPVLASACQRLYAHIMLVLARDCKHSIPAFIDTRPFNTRHHEIYLCHITMMMICL